MVLVLSLVPFLVLLHKRASSSITSTGTMSSTSASNTGQTARRQIASKERDGTAKEGEQESCPRGKRGWGGGHADTDIDKDTDTGIDTDKDADTEHRQPDRQRGIEGG